MQSTLDRDRTQVQGMTISDATVNLDTDTLRNHSREIVRDILPKINHDPLFHIWNELNSQSVNDPKAKYIVDMVNSRSFPLQSFVGKTVETYYGRGGSGTPPGGGGGGGGGTGGSGSY